MSLQLISKDYKFDNAAAIIEIANIKKILCNLKNQVDEDITNGLTSPSLDTVNNADMFFTTVIVSTYIGLSVNNGVGASKINVTSSLNVTKYGIIYPFSISIIGQPLIYTYTGLVNNNLSLALLLSNTNTSLYDNTNTPSVIEVLNGIDNNFTTVIGFLKKELAKKNTIPDYFIDDMLDVSISQPVSENEALVYSGCQWTNQRILLNSGIIDDTNINLSILTNGDSLIWNNSQQKWTNSNADLQQIVLANANGPITEMLPSSTWNVIDATNYGANGYFNLTTTNSGTYIINWTGVVRATVALELFMRITAIDGSMSIPTLETDTDTRLTMIPMTSQSVSINYAITNVNTSTIFILQWNNGSPTLLPTPVDIISGSFMLHKIN